MPFKLTSLPPEIISRYIVPALGADDIISLAKCIPLDLNRALYDRTFHDTTNLESYDLDEFERRSKAELIIYGDKGANIVHYGEHLHDNFEFVTSAHRRRMHTPCKAQNTGTIVDVCLDHNQLSVVDGDGDIRVCPTFPPDASPNQALYKLWKPFWAKAPRFVQLESGPFSTVGLDDNGVLWVWNNSRVGRPFRLWEEKTGRAITNRILMIRVGTHISCLVEEVGIVVFLTTPAVFPKEVEIQIWDPEAVDVTVVPGTNCRITDYVLMDRHALYLTGNGTVSCAQLDGAFTDPKLSTLVEELNEYGPFEKLSGRNSRVTLLTDGRVVTVQNIMDRYRWNFAIGLENIYVTSVAVGYAHTLVLTDEGEVYRWGEERNWNGCLGLGKFEDALQKENVRGWMLPTGESTLLLMKPTKLELPGAAYKVLAADDYSAVLVDASEK